MKHYIDIPENFLSDSSGKPFENCLMCGKDLLKGDTTYVVEKAMKNYDNYKFSSTIYEYAICSECHSSMQSKMSKESLKNMQEYYQEKITSSGKQSIAIDLNSFDLKKWLSKCFFTEKPVEEMKEYQLVAQFKGNKMLLNMPPMVIGEDILNDMADLLSNETIDEMNGFKKQFLGPPPEFEELIYGKRLILI